MTSSTRGVLWMVLAALFFSMIVIASKRVNHLPPFEQVFFQTSGVVICLLPWLIKNGLGAMATRNFKIHLIRALSAVAGMAAMFYAIRHMPAADVAALLLLTALFTVLLASLFLREPIGLRRGIAILVGLAGALIIIRPGFHASLVPALIMIFVAFAWAVVNVANRFLAGSENANAVVLYMYGMMGLFASIPTAIEWQTPAMADWPWLATLGIVSAVAQQGITRSFAAAPAAVVMPAYYLQLPFAAVIAFALFGEVPDMWIWVGGAIICGAAYYVVRLESRGR